MLRRTLLFEGEPVAWQNRQIARRLRDAETSLARVNEQLDRIAAERDEADGLNLALLDKVTVLEHELTEERLWRRCVTKALEAHGLHVPKVAS